MTIQTKQCNRVNYGGTRAATRYIVVHYTSNRGDTAKNNVDYFARENVGASAHFFVDEKETWSSVPEACVAWHCGAKSYRHPECRNSNALGVEICMNDKKGKVHQASIDRAALLVRALMAKYDIPVDRVLRHYDVTGKHCPGPMVDDPALWTAFLAKLTQTEQKEEDDMRYKYYDDMPDWAQPTVKKLMDKGYLKGEGDGVLNLSEDTLKVLVVGDRAGLYEA